MMSELNPCSKERFYFHGQTVRDMRIGGRGATLCRGNISRGLEHLRTLLEERRFSKKGNERGNLVALEVLD